MFGLLPRRDNAQAQAPGASRQAQGSFQQFLDPTVALPMAAALMGGQGNQQNFANAFANAGPGLAQAQQLRQQQAQKNATLEFLRQKSPEMAQAVESGMPVGEAWKTYLKQREAQTPGTPTYSKSPVYGTDKQGNTVLATIGDDGSFKQIDTGDFNVSTGFDKIDTGTEIILRDKRSGQVVSVTPKDVAGVERQKVVGKAEGERDSTKDASIAQMDEMLTAIDGVMDAPGREAATGMSGWFNAPFGVARPGSETADFMARLDQLEGKAFLQAFESLKGGGQITEREGLAAQNAIARLQRSQSDEEFKNALIELKSIVENAKARLTGNAPATPAAPSSNGTGMTTSNGSRVLSVEE